MYHLKEFTQANSAAKGDGIFEHMYVFRDAIQVSHVLLGSLPGEPSQEKREFQEKYNEELTISLAIMSLDEKTQVLRRRWEGTVNPQTLAGYTFDQYVYGLTSFIQNEPQEADVAEPRAAKVMSAPTQRTLSRGAGAGARAGAGAGADEPRPPRFSAFGARRMDAKSRTARQTAMTTMRSSPPATSRPSSPFCAVRRPPALPSPRLRWRRRPRCRWPAPTHSLSVTTTTAKTTTKLLRSAAVRRGSVMEWMRRQDHRLGSVYKMKEDQEYTEVSRGSLW